LECQEFAFRIDLHREKTMQTPLNSSRNWHFIRGYISFSALLVNTLFI
jgi:hypothetical protein